MRTKTNQKIPQNLEDFVHSINTVKTKNKKTASKNSGNINVNLSKNSHEKMDNGDCRFDSGMVEDECNKVMRDGDEEVNGSDGFVGDLNGVQFPLINGMVGSMNEKSEGEKDCLVTKDNYNSGGVNTNSGDCVEAVNEGNASANNEIGVEVNDEVDIVNSSMLDNKLLNVPTEVSENGNNVYGFNEAMYHIRIMWNRFGLRDVIAKNDVFYFKFQDKGGIKEILVWVKMMNVPMEAWSVKGISALASGIGKLVIMDEITTKMCVTRVGRISFARVLVELDVENGIKDKIEIMYKSKNVAEGTKKIVDVEYSWIPCICSHCKVFGHTDSYCKIKSKNVIDDSSVKANKNEFKVV
ncbi:RNA-directed DNA polymerase, eukaryota, reverse transcriptase zinc-binding domain protein [Tanacetum coccineum]